MRCPAPAASFSFVIQAQVFVLQALSSLRRRGLPLLPTFCCLLLFQLLVVMTDYKSGGFPPRPAKQVVQGIWRITASP